MTLGRKDRRGRTPAGRLLHVCTKRGVILAAVLVAAGIATVVAASATTHSSPARVAVERSATSLRPSMAGGGATSAKALRHRKAVRGHLPKTVTHTHPRELHLKAAHGKVFDVRKLKSAVVKKERPERTAPGYAPAGSRAAERLENPGRSLPQLPKVIKKSQMVSAPAPAPSASFEGLDFANWGQGHPPDTNGDVGPNYYIQTINVSIGIYAKSTGSRVAAFTFNSFMSQGNFGNLCDTDNFGDPVVLYDSFEDRWVVTDFALKLDGAGNVNPQHVFECFAVSKTGDPVTGGWNFYSVETPGGLGDYPKLGVWPDGIYLSANMFGYAANASFFGYHVWALNKQQMYAGDPSPQVVDFAGDTSDFSLVPANARLQTGTPPAGASEYFVSTEQFLNALSIYKLHVDWDKVSTSTFTGPVTQAAAACWPNANPANASTPANSADTLAIRAMAQAQYSNLGGAESLWVAHTVNRGEIPNATCGAANTNNATLRWYQANVTGGTVAANVVQGTTFDPEAANTFFRFMPSLAVDLADDMSIGYTKSNSTTNPQLKYAGRLAGDPANTLGQTEQTLINGTGAQSGNCGGAPCTRWGDYSGMALDPNGCDFWETGEYYATTGLNHQTRIGAFRLPGCTTVGNGTLSGTVTDGTNPLAGATVALGNRTATTDGSGGYSFNVPAGTYSSLTVSKPGFTSGSAATIPVPDGGTATRNFALGASAQSGCFTDNSQSTFQRGVPSNCDLNASPGNVVLTNQPNADQQASSSSGSGFRISTTQWIGQTFVPSVSGQLTKIDMSLFCASCSGPDQPLTIEVRTTSANLPTSTVLASTTIPGFSSGASATYSPTFASPATLTAGTKYAFVVKLLTARTGNYDAIFSTGPTAYANGDLIATTNSGTSWLIPTTGGTARDMLFKTYMSAGFASAGTLVSSLKDANPNPGSTPNWTTLSFAATTPAGTAVKFQVAGSNSSAGPFNFVGPDTTSATFFTTSGASLSQFNGFRYLKYKAFLSTTNGAVTPTLSSVQVCFTDVAPTSPTSLAVAPATGTFGGTTTLSATLTSGGSPVTGKTVSFTLNGSPAGSAVTNGSGIASESGVSLTGINAGSYPTGVGASFAGDPSYDPSNNSGSLTVNKADQAISFGPLADKQTTDPPFTVSATGGASGNAVTFSTASSACSVSGTTVTILTSGTCAVDANQAGATNYNPAPQVTQSFSIGKTSQTITFPAIADFSWSGGSATLTATASSGLAVSYSVLSGPCSITGSTLTASHAGSCVVAADQAGNATYSAAAQQTQNANVTKANQTINVTTHAPSSAVFNTQFAVAATGGGSGNAVTFANAGVCSTTGATFTMTSGTGTCSVKYDQAGNSDYNAAPQVVETVTAQKANQTITVSLHAPSTAVFNSSFGVAATAPGGAVSFSSAGSCSNSGATFTITSGSGTCSVKYDQAGDGNYNAAPQVTESTTAQQAEQTILVTLHAPSTAAFNSSFGVAASGGGSGNPVTVSTAGVCSNTGATVTMTSGSGTCSVKFDQAGNGNYNAAPQVTESTTAQKAAQAINVTTHAPSSAVYNTGFSVAATGGASGNPVTFSSAGACSNSGGAFTMTSGTGTCSVKYDQAGDANYNAAPQVTESVTAQKAGQTITFAPLPDKTYGDPDFTVSATSDSGLAVSFGATGSCTVSGTTVHLTGPGSCTVTASQPGDGNYSPAPDVPRTFQVNPPAETVARLTGKDATCTQVTGGTAPALTSAQYVEKNGVIKKAIPNQAAYWVKVHLSAGTHTVEVDQAITSGNFTQKLTLANGSKAYTAACGKVKQPTFTSGAGGSVTAGLNAAATGDYWIAVRYQGSAINGQPTPAPTTIHYLFSTAGVAGSSATLDVLRQVAARPAFLVRLRR